MRRCSHSEAIYPLITHVGIAVSVYTSGGKDDILRYCEALHEDTAVVVMVGGDGTLHETPHLCIVPCGSGNAVANSLSGLQMSVCNSVLSLIHGTTTDTTPMSVTLPTTATEETTVYSTCVLSCGFHAKLIEQSDRLRWFGRSRFTMVAAKLLMWPPNTDTVVKLYRARDTSKGEHVPMRDTHTAEAPEKDACSSQDFTTLNGQLRYFIASKVAELEPGFTIAPYAHAAMRGMDILAVDEVAPDSTSLTTILGAVGKGDRGSEHLDLYGAEVQCLRTEKFDIYLGKDNGLVCVDGELFRIPPSAFHAPCRTGADRMTVTQCDASAYSVPCCEPIAGYSRPIKVRPSPVKITMYCAK
ncbi:hypothetical protein SARC_08949 [Sphaeroforma arctica JP610]|uniref:DAGKc domain-containing protein n=1 Tax=Sphaeroforma arctica JP610 TaxID=667725 RepID=A0A0L0FPJ3_9EUKA|nr:hypothetical protein SARC_08949 [Sphaeroforma arctica JP610]KNC78629.1 hypothetical protein SARC_08949 [Sphaeroforma arctica JP610]|eukprot:XP_014152531.1 hypothetical protein SARC_08949 [Sphaeroforma arctica JP610]